MASLIVPPEMREAHRRGLGAYLEGGDAQVLDRRIEIEAIRSDGTRFPVEAQVVDNTLQPQAKITADLQPTNK